MQPFFHKEGKSRFFWIFDNGHGALQKGKQSPKAPDGYVFREYEFNAAIVQGVVSQLIELNIDCMMTVPDYESTGSFLPGRVKRANEFHSDRAIFVSVHANAAPAKDKSGWSEAAGVETWYYRGSSVGRNLAGVFQQFLTWETGLKDRGLKETKDFYVLKHTRMPAVLTENGFFNNLKEMQYLRSAEGRASVIRAHVNAVKQIERFGALLTSA